MITTEPETETTTKSAYADLAVEVSTAKARAEKVAETKTVAVSTAAESNVVEPTEVEQTKVTETERATESVGTAVSTTKAEETIKKSGKTDCGNGVYIDDDEFNYITRLVYGEAGAEPYDGQVLVAQCIYNGMKETGLNAYETKKHFKYSGSTTSGTSESVKKAVRAVFYQGYRYTEEEVLFFYAPGGKGHWSDFHESQTFVCEVGGHRYFKRNGA
jgi:hypothetical protein